MTNPSRTTVLKLRHSCEACALSKVKCQKQKPTCSRCQRRGVDCHYLAIKRAGRRYGSPRVDSTHLSPLVGPGPRLELSDLNSWLGASASTSSTDAPSDDMFLRQLLSTTASSIGSPFIQSPTVNSVSIQSNDELFMENTLSSISTPYTISNSLDIGSSILSPINLPMDLEEYMSPDIKAWTPKKVETSVINPALSSGLSQIPPVWTPTTTATAPTIGHQNCIKRSMEILQQKLCHRKDSKPRNDACELHVLDTEAESDTQILDSVIEENKQAIDAVNSMLNCQCLQDGYLITILSLIVFKVLESYSAAASAPEAQGPELDTTEDNEVCIAAQKVLGELHRVQRLVNQLSVRIKIHTTAESQGAMSNASTSCGLDKSSQISLLFSTEILRQLETDMRKRLKCLSLGMAAHLRRD